MNKKLFIGFIFWLLVPACVLSQTPNKMLDSLHHALNASKDDTIRMLTLKELAGFYAESNRDSAMYFFEAGISLAQKINQQLWLANLLLGKSYILQKQANYTVSLKLCNKALAIYQDKKNEKGAYLLGSEEFHDDPAKYRYASLMNVYHQMGNIYNGSGNKKLAIGYYQQEIAIAKELNSKSGLVTSNMNIGSIYADLNQQDSAFIYSKRALDNAISTGWRDYEGFILEDIGAVFFKNGIMDSAKYYFTAAVKANQEKNNLAGESSSNNSLGSLFEKSGRYDSMLIYAQRALTAAYRLNSARAIVISSEQVATAWRLIGNRDSALSYLLISKHLGDSLLLGYNKKVTEFQQTSFEEQLRLEKEATESTAARNRIRTIALFSGLALLAILALVFYRNFRQRKKSYHILEKTLQDLKATQSQLIQSEKMASLGELTAGIAHEIQNPLNFVNNFSDVNKELLTELKDEIKKGNFGEVEVIAADVISNAEKISHHGKRADAIVKGMLQHSRAGNGKKEPTDINVLCDEYLRLAYHGLRAKDKFFNATMKTSFDDMIGKVKIIPQDIGRVILNLITNAFYAVNEKSKQGIAGYEPTVEVHTTLSPLPGRGGGAEVSIIVKDNGNGIPESIREKIFQPFFTTKPTGQGTGLGLSLSYDIVKAHGGALNVETKEGEGSTFIIQLPDALS